MVDKIQVLDCALGLGICVVSTRPCTILPSFIQCRAMENVVYRAVRGFSERAGSECVTEGGCWRDPGVGS